MCFWNLHLDAQANFFAMNQTKVYLSTPRDDLEKKIGLGAKNGLAGLRLRRKAGQVVVHIPKNV